MKLSTEIAVMQSQVVGAAKRGVAEAEASRSGCEAS